MPSEGVILQLKKWFRSIRFQLLQFDASNGSSRRIPIKPRKFCHDLNTSQAVPREAQSEGASFSHLQLSVFDQSLARKLLFHILKFNINFTF